MKNVPVSASTWLRIYKTTLRLGKPLIERALQKRIQNGKEDPARLAERHGVASRTRPAGKLIWIHVASVGEAQSIRILIDEILSANPELNILVTSVTRTSGELLGKSLPPRAFYQYAPFDHPDWVNNFLNHWKPDMALRVESELWPATLAQLKKRHIPTALLNARLSPKSAKRWELAGSLMTELLSTFTIILCQSKLDEIAFRQHGATHVITAGNIKYTAHALPYNSTQLDNLTQSMGHRPAWIYASTHHDEESIAARIHQSLKSKIPNMLTFIAPRHPERTAQILNTLATTGLYIQKHSDQKPITTETDLYIIDTMGELGLFYKLSQVAMIGRSLSLDGGGGHNPLESMRVGTVTINGPHIQNLKDIYDDVESAQAGLTVKDETDLQATIEKLLTDQNFYNDLQYKTNQFIKDKNKTLDITLDELEPIFLETGITPPRSHIHTQGVKG